MVKCVTAIVLVLISSPIAAESQVEERGLQEQASVPSDSTGTNLAAISFDKSLNTYHWNGSTLYKNIFGPFSLSLNEQFLSTVIRTDKNLITDNQTFDLHVAERIADHLQLAGKVSSFLLSDTKDIDISNASSHAVYGGIAFQPLDGVSIEPLIGERYDNQLDHHDRGPSYLLNLSGDDLLMGGYRTTFSGQFQYDHLSPRTLETYTARAQFGKAFTEQSRNFLQITYNRNRRDFYLTADAAVQQDYGISYNIESRTDNSLGVVDSLNYGVTDRAALTFVGNIVSRHIDRLMRYTSTSDPLNSPASTAIDELRVGGAMRATIAPTDYLHGDLSLLYNERQETHALRPQVEMLQYETDSLSRNEQRKNNLSRRTTIASSIAASVSSTDTVALSGSASILRYDTPSSDNTDDHDELWYVLNLSANHHFNSHLDLGVDIDMSLTHLVYLYSAESANNTWNRILRLSPTIDYRPAANFHTTNTFEVLANYTAYDFEYLSSQTESYVFRQFAFIDSSAWELSRRLSLGWFSHIRLYERGELQWDEFSERPVYYCEEKTYAGTLRYALTERLLFSVGIRYFSQLRFGYDDGERVLTSMLRTIGPMAGLKASVGQRTTLSMDGWCERQTQTGQTARTISTMVMFLNVRI